MNGAIAEPWVSTISPPKTSRTSMIGSSQNFFRARRKVQNSSRKDIESSGSELVLHAFGRRSCRLARDPVGLVVTAPSQRQQVLVASPHEQRDRSEERRVGKECR